MRKTVTSVLGAVLTIAAGVILLSLTTAVAQQPWRGGPHWDMWNPYWMHRDMWGRGPMGPGLRHRMARHWTFMHEGVPDEYARARSPYTLTDEKAVEEGRTLYTQNCASCHGAKGMGDGEAGKALNPSPALLAYMIQMPMAVDEYMLWTISEGGKAFGTEMPAFKDTLTKDQIWKIVTYMRAGFSGEKAAKKE